jgi:hypothetical protein
MPDHHERGARVSQDFPLASLHTQGDTTRIFYGADEAYRHPGSATNPNGL